MDWPQIRQRIAQGEGAHTEFKRTLEFRLVGRSICDFGNTGRQRAHLTTTPVATAPWVATATGLVFNLVG